MDIIKLQGTDKKLYELIAPLVLNPAVLRQNNNYPFKTGPKYTWYIAIEKEQILGFIPIKQTSVSSPNDPHFWLEHGVSIKVRNRAIAFMQKVQDVSRSGQNPAVALASEYGKTYWYYYMFNTINK